MSQTPWVYRDYIWDSYAEFSTAKNAYVATQSGWFSCRTACYLASGRPAVVQDTGYSRFMRQGVLAFTNEAEALAGIEAVRADWDRHSAAAEAFAARYFDSDVVLAKLLADALASPATRHHCSALIEKNRPVPCSRGLRLCSAWLSWPDRLQPGRPRASARPASSG